MNLAVSNDVETAQLNQQIGAKSRIEQWANVNELVEVQRPSNAASKIMCTKVVKVICHSARSGAVRIRSIRAQLNRLHVYAL